MYLRGLIGTHNKFKKTFKNNKNTEKFQNKINEDGVFKKTLSRFLRILIQLNKSVEIICALKMVDKL